MTTYETTIPPGEGRLVEYRFSSVDLNTLIENTRRDRVLEALGYLSQWNMTFPRVQVFIGSDHEEITAVYFHADGTRGYVIGAVWHVDHFGFHS